MQHNKYRKRHVLTIPAKTKNHEAASLPSLVENLVKNWEIEASFKTSISDWRTIDRPNYTFAINVSEAGTFSPCASVPYCLQKHCCRSEYKTPHRLNHTYALFSHIHMLTFLYHAGRPTAISGTHAEGRNLQRHYRTQRILQPSQLGLCIFPQDL